ncbi:MAG: WHG domain-containing protein [Jiangellales bacterium]
MPRAGLTTERVVVEAEHLADQVGVDNVSLAALADTLGVRQPSLYKHIDGLPALKRAIAVRAKAELAEVLGRAAVGRSGDDAIRALATAYRTWAHQHPGRYQAALHAPDPDDPDDEAASTAAVTVVLDILAGYQWHGPDAIHAARGLRSALHGFVSLEAAGGFGLPQSLDDSYDLLVEASISTLRREPGLG